jgi:hypothetical protein
MADFAVGFDDPKWDLFPFRVGVGSLMYAMM